MRISIALLTILTTAFHSTVSQGCCLSDRLYGRPAVPYAVGYAPYGYVAQYAPVAATPYAAGYSTTAATTSVLTARPAWNPVPVLTSGAYQAQRPSYYDNPSVYTGLPVTRNAQTSYSLPITNAIPAPVTTSPYVGAGNPYASNYRAAYGSAYPNTAAPGLPITTTTQTGVPATAIPATPVAPVYATPAPAPKRACGLSRFFGSHSRTNYRTSYYRAPVTYYRPVTTVDPVTGTTVTVQQPCTSYVQQVQRTPYSSLQFAQPAQVQPANQCQTAPGGCQTAPGGCQTAPVGGYGINPYTPGLSTQGSTYAAPPASGIGQVGAIGSTDQSVVPIPSIAPATGGYYGAPSGAPAPGVAPLTGTPPASSPTTSPPPANGDRAPVDQPSLQNYPTPDANPDRPQGEPTQPSSQPPASHWKLQGPEDSMAMIRPTAPRQVDTQREATSPSAGQFTGVEPIEAPAEYVSPFRQRIEAPSTPATQSTMEAPPLPVRTIDPADVTSNRVAGPFREAALIRARAPRQPVAQKRDAKWYPIEP